jgi:BirA family biotin operon repressor/biotin-[acetyl-CoA-carboxylase] ligase
MRSTNTHAAALRKRGALFAPAVVLTSRQIAGRGRGGNSWFSTPGCLTATFVFPVEDRMEAHQLPLIAGIAVRNAAAELTNHAPIQLKWPNDVMHDHRKLAGLLCERLDKVDLIGIGLNVNVAKSELPLLLRNSAASLSQIAGHMFDMTDVLLTLSRHLQLSLQSRNSHTFAIFRAQYDQHHALTGRNITVVNAPEPAVSGKCIGIDDIGRLLLRTRSVTHRVLAGHVVF